MQPTGTPSDLLPPQMVASMIRNGGSPNSMFPQDPLAQGIQPGAMGADPGLQTPPPPGSQAQNMSMPPQGGQPMPGQPQAGTPDQMPGATQLPQTSEAEMLIKILGDRLQHHSKITQGTLGTLSKMIEAGIPLPEQNGQGTPPSA